MLVAISMLLVAISNYKWGGEGLWVGMWGGVEWGELDGGGGGGGGVGWW